MSSCMAQGEVLESHLEGNTGHSAGQIRGPGKQRQRRVGVRLLALQEVAHRPRPPHFTSLSPHSFQGRGDPGTAWRDWPRGTCLGRTGRKWAQMRFAGETDPSRALSQCLRKVTAGGGHLKACGGERREASGPTLAGALGAVAAQCCPHVARRVAREKLLLRS